MKRIIQLFPNCALLIRSIFWKGILTDIFTFHNTYTHSGMTMALYYRYMRHCWKGRNFWVWSISVGSITMVRIHPNTFLTTIGFFILSILVNLVVLHHVSFQIYKKTNNIEFFFCLIVVEILQCWWSVGAKTWWTSLCYISTGCIIGTHMLSTSSVH